MTRTKIPARYGKAARLKKGESIKVSQHAICQNSNILRCRNEQPTMRRQIYVPYMVRMASGKF